ncbi:hypothetical protein [Deinococcus hopiensis]|uniref:Uncharacterized protein n=1 Tax=Deinococcus hopiensis KR-140 TaxID=695939 RepID=A0A1W1UXS3_9DEIO|nr:hypothetical protein [Deinococcus hopiensis]SMB85892.1 hypothetical protein SAMN00790413_03590 [Deinococcus hopiensis KR-140]
MRRYLHYTYVSKVKDTLHQEAEEEVRDFGSPSEFLSYCEAMEHLRQDERDPLIEFYTEETTQATYELRAARLRAMNWDDVATEVTS